jgi:hypothetical protein
MMKEQIWLCEKCKMWGRIGYEEHEDIMSVAHKIFEHHKKASQYKCDGDATTIRVIND